MKTKTLLVFELVFLFGFATAIAGLMFLHNYTFHFAKVTLNFYPDGTSDFTTDATNLVRSLGAITMLSLIFGISSGAAVSLTYSNFKKVELKQKAESYDEQIAKTGLVKINRTSEGATYQLTELGRRFLNEYRFLEKLEKTVVQS